MTRNLWTLLLGTVLAIAVGNLACNNTIKQLDNSDESDGAT
jgi:hypothetical protein